MSDIKWYGNEVNGTVDAAIEQFLETAALVVEGEAKNRCPVGQYPRGSGRVGGHLRESITYEVDKKEARVGTNVHYAPYVELGTVKMKAQPYLRPALDENKNKLGDLAQQILDAHLGGG